MIREIEARGYWTLVLLDRPLNESRTRRRLDCFRSRRINIADHNLRAALRKELRGRTANPPDSPRDKRDFT